MHSLGAGESKEEILQNPLAVMQVDFSTEEIPWSHGRDLYKLWLELKGDKPWPARRDFSLPRMSNYLEYIILIDVEQNPLDFVVRLCGTGHRPFMKFEPTGASFSTTVNGPEYVARFEKLIELGKPYIGVNQYIPWIEDPHMHHRRMHGIALPLGNDDKTINMMMLLAHYF